MADGPPGSKRNAYMTSAPIFIGGLFKSGTSLLRAMLGQHSRIAAGLETYWFDVDWEGQHGRNGEPLEDYVERVASFFDIDREWARTATEQSGSAPEFVSRMLDEFAARQNKPRWAEKTPGNILHVAQILDYWPNAKLIHIVRDPRDVYASLRQTRKWDSVEVFGNLWCKFLGAGNEAGNPKANTAGALYEIRYENLILNPETCMKRVLKFIGESWESDVAKFSGKSDDYEKVVALSGVASSTLDRLRHPLTDSRIGIWRDLIGADELVSLRNFIIERNLGNLYDRIIEATPSASFH